MDEKTKAKHDYAVSQAYDWASLATRMTANADEHARMAQAWIAIAREIREASHEQ